LGKFGPPPRFLSGCAHACISLSQVCECACMLDFHMVCVCMQILKCIMRCAYVCRDVYITSDIPSIAAGPLYYPLSLNRCQETEFENEHLQRYEASPSPTARCNKSSSAGVANFLRDKKISNSGLSLFVRFNVSASCGIYRAYWHQQSVSLVIKSRPTANSIHPQTDNDNR